MASVLNVAIVGGGPAGLMLARLLSLSSIQCTVFERDLSPASRTQGGTLDIHGDTGILALKEGGLYDAFLAHSRPEGEDFILADKTGRRWVDQQGTGDQPAGNERPEIDREKLREILLKSVPENCIRWNSNVRSIGEDRTLQLDSGIDGPFDLVVGGDGGFSHVRSLLSDSKPFYSGIGGVEFQFADVDNKAAEVSKHVGRGSFFAFSDGFGLLAQRLGDKSLKVSAYGRRPEDFPKNFTSSFPNGGEEAKNKILEDYSDWAPEFQAWVKQADDHIIARSLYMLPVGYTWEHKPGFTLIGDAAHLWTPFAGEGVNAALMDSLELSRAIIKYASGADTSLDALVKGYEEAMFVRTKPIAEETKRNLDMFFTESFPPPNFEQLLRQMGGEGPPAE